MQSKYAHKKFQTHKIIFFIPHRPDLLDWRQVERREVRERIDLAFHVMDREYGVTRLLDPEGESTYHSVSPSDPFLIYLKSWRDQYIGKDLLEKRVSGAPPEGSCYSSATYSTCATSPAHCRKGHLDASSLLIGKPGGWHK